MQRRAAGAALATAAVIFFLAEFIAAAAWTDPPYSYTYHYISDLGVHGPFGRLHRHLGVARKAGKTMVMLGAFGLVSMVAFLAVAGSGANVLVGLVERCAVYPVLIGLICAGVSIWNRRPSTDTDEAG